MEGPTGKELGRNDPCHCGSGKKYKNCHLGKDEEAARAARAKAAEAAPAPAAEPEPSGAKVPVAPPRHATQQPWKKSATNTRSFQRMTSPRKVGGS
ncbi:MAG TPA: SEC-C metal-binding domain-containing protein [Vicinamibacteria bacterium]